jgi:hypothetical protein
MRAPVYRNIEARDSFLGLDFPTEVVTVLAVFWVTAYTLPMGLAAGATVLAYAGLRAVNMGRAPQFLKHWLIWQLRRHRSGGRLSAAARTRAPYFPYADGGGPK